MRRPRRWLTCFLLAGGVAAAAPWPEATSDLPPDPALHQGRLENGLRFLILRNAEPRERVSLRLVVAAGSRHENDDERGLAHFVEHMAFRSTRAFPAGALTQALQRLGLALGPDSTAFTGYDHTIYHLELPDASESMLQEGLRAFREYAEGVTFEENLIERERGVVLSELATRDTPHSRMIDANVQFLWARSHEVNRKPIGLPALIRTFTRPQFTAFYDAWYRPERMALIVAGDIDPAVAERSIAELFSPLVARGPVRPEPPEPTGTEAGQPNVAVFAEPGLLGLNLTFERPIYFPRQADTHERRVREIHQVLAFAMFQARLQRRAKQPDASYLGPTAAVTAALHRWRLVALSANAKIDDWQRAAADIEQEHRRAFNFGFTPQELTEARAGFVNAVDQSVRSAATRPSPLLAQQLVSAVLHGGVFATPAEIQRDVAGPLAAATLEDCVAAFRAAWTAGAPSVFVGAHPAFQITRAQIAAALNASRQTAVTLPVEMAGAEFAYTDFGPPGRLVREAHHADLDVRLSEFANGVRLNFKSTTFASDLVELHVRVGEGQLRQPENLPGLNLLADAMTTAGGLGKHTTEELSRLLAGRTVRMAFQVQTDACLFTAHCARRDLALCLQLITAFLTDAAYRPTALREAQAGFNTMYAAFNASPTGPITALALREISGDRRFGVPQITELFARGIPEMKTWIEPQFKKGAIEMSVVGDVSWAEASSAVAATLGALPRREARRAAPAGQLKPRAAPVAPKAYLLDAQQQRQCAIVWYWPVTMADMHEERRCRLLARVLGDRFRQRLRDELGASYTPAAGFNNLPGFPHLSHYVVFAELEPARVNAAMEILERETKALATTGPTADEFDRAKQPYLHEMTDNLRTNIYWGSTVLSDAQQNPIRLAAARDRAPDIVAITREDLAAAARRHFTPRAAFKFVTILAPTAPAPAR